VIPAGNQSPALGNQKTLKNYKNHLKTMNHSRTGF